MGWLFGGSDKGGWGGKATKAERARAVRAQERWEKEKVAIRRGAKIQRGFDKGRAKGFWDW